MNALLLVWAGLAAVCVTMGLLHLLAWALHRRDSAYLIFSVAALAAAAHGVIELLLMQTATVPRFVTLHRCVHVTAFTVIVSMVWFTRYRLGTGRLWLAWTAVASRVAILIVELAFPWGVNFSHVAEMRSVRLFGLGDVYAPIVLPASWRPLVEASAWLCVLFVADASVAAWRRGDRSRALIVGGSVVVFMCAAFGVVGLVNRGQLAWPYVSTAAFVAVILTTGAELSLGIVRASRLAEELRESEANMRLAADAAGLGLWTWDLRTDDIWASSAARTMFGVSAGARIDFATFVSLVHPDDRGHVDDAIRRAVEGEDPYGAEYRIRRPGGATLHIAARGEVERDINGSAARLRGVVLDVTARKRAESEVHRSRAELAHLARVATLSEISSGVAHELSQPLTAILSNAQAAKRYLDSGTEGLDEIRAILDDIVRDDKRAGAVIHRLRSMLSNKTPVLELVDVNDVVHEALHVLNSEIVGGDVVVEIRLATAGAEIEASRVEFLQVLINLIVNAIHAMSLAPRHGRVLNIRTDVEAGRVRLEVADSGPGIAPEVLSRVFESFVTTKPGGLGIGLALCRRLVEAHGGQIRARNLPGGGASVTVDVPARGSVGPPAPAGSKPESGVRKG